MSNLQKTMTFIRQSQLSGNSPKRPTEDHEDYEELVQIEKIQVYFPSLANSMF